MEEFFYWHRHKMQKVTSFSISFYIVDKECDPLYGYFFEEIYICVKDTEELCIILDRHPSIHEYGFNFLYFGSLWLLYEASWRKYLKQLSQ